MGLLSMFFMGQDISLIVSHLDISGLSSFYIYKMCVEIYVKTFNSSKISNLSVSCKILSVSCKISQYQKYILVRKIRTLCTDKRANLYVAFC